jgi:hypothetical protein
MVSKLFHCTVPKSLIRKIYYVLFLISVYIAMSVLERLVPSHRRAAYYRCVSWVCSPGLAMQELNRVTVLIESGLFQLAQSGASRRAVHRAVIAELA